MTEPKRLIVEHQDGTTTGIDFNQLSRSTWFELSQLGLCSPPSVMPPPSTHYLLLRWKDGWQEVIGVDKGSAELLRYYILERVEEVGRMALEVEGNYPVLLMIKRLPKTLESLMIIGRGGSRAYGLEPKSSREEGGKIEHLQYDGTDPQPQDQTEKSAEVWVDEIMGALRTELNKRGLTAEKLLALSQTQRAEKYKELAKALGIRATEKQEDVYGFLQSMMKPLAESAK